MTPSPPPMRTGLWALQFFWSAIHTPIHQIFWSAIRTPIHNYFWSADWCTPNSTPLHKLDWSANWSAALYSSLQSILPSALQSNFHSKIWSKQDGNLACGVWIGVTERIAGWSAGFKVCTPTGHPNLWSAILWSAILHSILAGTPHSNSRSAISIHTPKWPGVLECALRGVALQKGLVLGIRIRKGYRQVPEGRHQIYGIISFLKYLMTLILDNFIQYYIIDWDLHWAVRHENENTCYSVGNKRAMAL